VLACVWLAVSMGKCERGERSQVCHVYADRHIYTRRLKRILIQFEPAGPHRHLYVSELVQGAHDSTQVGVQHVARSAGTSRLSRRVAAHGSHRQRVPAAPSVRPTGAPQDECPAPQYQAHARGRTYARRRRDGRAVEEEEEEAAASRAQAAQLRTALVAAHKTNAEAVAKTRADSETLCAAAVARGRPARHTLASCRHKQARRNHGVCGAPPSSSALPLPVPAARARGQCLGRPARLPGACSSVARRGRPSLARHGPWHGTARHGRRGPQVT
jgi:hypothetical protein